MLQEFVANLTEFYAYLNLPDFRLNNSSFGACDFFMLRPEAIVGLVGGDLHIGVGNVFFLRSAGAG